MAANDWGPSSGYWGPPPQPQRTNPLAIAALVCGIAEFFVFPAAIAAVILGHMARRQIRRTGEDGRGLATAGLLLGYILCGLIIAVLGLILVLSISLSSAPGTPVTPASSVMYAPVPPG